eukprot:Sspe_Gene.81465::Locus_52221_Transcript_1_1_Confidence_1.000_Length_2148::g.81465::m.81465
MDLRPLTLPLDVPPIPVLTLCFAVDTSLSMSRHIRGSPSFLESVRMAISGLFDPTRIRAPVSMAVQAFWYHLKALYRGGRRVRVLVFGGEGPIYVSPAMSEPVLPGVMDGLEQALKTLTPCGEYNLLERVNDIAKMLNEGATEDRVSQQKPVGYDTYPIGVCSSRDIRSQHSPAVIFALTDTFDHPFSNPCLSRLPLSQVLRSSLPLLLWNQSFSIINVNAAEEGCIPDTDVVLYAKEQGGCALRVRGGGPLSAGICESLMEVLQQGSMVPPTTPEAMSGHDHTYGARLFATVGFSVDIDVPSSPSRPHLNRTVGSHHFVQLYVVDPTTPRKWPFPFSPTPVPYYQLARAVSPDTFQVVKVLPFDYYEIQPSAPLCAALIQELRKPDVVFYVYNQGDSAPFGVVMLDQKSGHVLLVVLPHNFPELGALLASTSPPVSAVQQYLEQVPPVYFPRLKEAVLEPKVPAAASLAIPMAPHPVVEQARMLMANRTVPQQTPTSTPNKASWGERDIRVDLPLKLSGGEWWADVVRRNLSLPVRFANARRGLSYDATHVMVRRRGARFLLAKRPAKPTPHTHKSTGGTPARQQHPQVHHPPHVQPLPPPLREPPTFHRPACLVSSSAAWDKSRYKKLRASTQVRLALSEDTPGRGVEVGAIEVPEVESELLASDAQGPVEVVEVHDVDMPGDEEDVSVIELE